jgi:hypothetical protein
MGIITKYVCPIHKNIVLYTEELGTHLVVIERPQTCHICKKSYYKNECEQEFGGGNNEDEG